MEYTEEEAERRDTLRGLIHQCYAEASSRGWHDESEKHDTGILTAARLMLIVSEVGEAMEADRRDAMDDKLPRRKGLEVELADAVIRIFDLSAARGLDLAGAIFEKMEYNRTRHDHSREARQQPDGKKY